MVSAGGNPRLTKVDGGSRKPGDSNNDEASRQKWAQIEVLSVRYWPVGVANAPRSQSKFIAAIRHIAEPDP